MSNRSYYVIMNPRAGALIQSGLTVDALQALFLDAGYRAEFDANIAMPWEQRIDRALASDADVIVAAGGDGTVTAVANAVLDTGKTMAILPFGTANLLAKDLCIPLDVQEWLSELARMRPRLIDAGVVNGRVFLHKVVIGMIPGIAAGRELVRGRGDLRATLGFLGYLLRRLARARPLSLEITTSEGGSRTERVQALAVANNAYDEALGCFFSRARLDAGCLTLYTLRRLTMRDLVRLAAEMVAGCWREDEALTIESVQNATIRSRKRHLKAMIDGEVETLKLPLRFFIRPGALRILAPAAPEAVVEAAALPMDAVDG